MGAMNTSWLGDEPSLFEDVVDSVRATASMGRGIALITLALNAALIGGKQEGKCGRI